jgi:hypothetical protein
VAATVDAVGAADVAATASGAKARTDKQMLRGRPYGRPRRFATLLTEARATTATVGTESVQTSVDSGGIVDREGGGCSPHPEGGGARDRCSVAAA